MFSWEYDVIQNESLMPAELIFLFYFIFILLYLYAVYFNQPMPTQEALRSLSGFKQMNLF